MELYNEDFVTEQNILNTGVYVNAYYKQLCSRKVIVEGKERIFKYSSPSSVFKVLIDNVFGNDSEYFSCALNVLKNKKPDHKTKSLEEIKLELQKVGINCCMVNFYYLCEYVIQIVKNRNLFVLKPQIEDTLSELSKVESITFTNKDGSKSTSNSRILIKTVLEALKANKNSNLYEVDKIVQWDKFAKKEIIQAVFAHELSEFLREFFPHINRRQNCTVTDAEKDLIAYFSFLFDLSKTVTSTARFRQLDNIYKRINYNPKLYEIEPNKFILGDVVKYKEWKKGELSFEALKPDELIGF